MGTTNMLVRHVGPKSRNFQEVVSRLLTNNIWMILTGISMLAFVIRFYVIDSHSIWFDEMASIEVAQRGLGTIFTDRFGWMLVQTPLHYLTVWLTIQPIDPTVSAVMVRLPSAIAGALTPLVVYGLGKEFFGRAQGLIAASLVSVSFIHISYSEDVRPYTILMLFTALSVYCLVRAEKSGSGKWWAAFAAASIVNQLYSYNVLTLVLPMMAPYILWILWKLRPWKKENVKSFIYAIAALGAVGLFSLFAFLDVLSVPRISPDLSSFSLISLVSSSVELCSWFTMSGLGGQVDRILQATMLILMAIALWPLDQQKVRKGVLLSLLVITVPPAILAVLSTTNVVYQRYALFVMPFFFLLVAHGFVRVVELANLPEKLAHFSRYSRGITIVVLGLLLAPFALGPVAYAGITAGNGTPVIDSADFREASAYLAKEAAPGDTIVFAGWDPTVGLFFWKNNPPAPTFSILDPKLPDHNVQGSVYWVVSYAFDMPSELRNASRWTGITQFYHVLIMREEPPAGNMLPQLEHFLADVEHAKPVTRVVEQPVNTLRGSVFQARGEFDSAVQAYRTGGTLFPIGGEYLRTSKGFAEHEEPERAWRDALISKSLQPEEPEIHRWLAELLRRENLMDLSANELEVARLLEAAAKSK